MIKDKYNNLKTLPNNNAISLFSLLKRNKSTFATYNKNNIKKDTKILTLTKNKVIFKKVDKTKSLRIKLLKNTKYNSKLITIFTKFKFDKKYNITKYNLPKDIYKPNNLLFSKLTQSYINTKPYLILQGGNINNYEEIYIYNIKENNWVKYDFPKDQGRYANGFVNIKLSNYCLLFGGIKNRYKDYSSCLSNDSKLLKIYKSNDKIKCKTYILRSISIFDNIPKERYNFAICSNSNGNGFVLGGITYNGEFLSDLWEYGINIKEKKIYWNLVISQSDQFYKGIALSSVVYSPIDNYVYTFGGLKNNNNCTNKVRRYIKKSENIDWEIVNTKGSIEKRYGHTFNYISKCILKSKYIHCIRR